MIVHIVKKQMIQLLLTRYLNLTPLLNLQVWSGQISVVEERVDYQKGILNERINFFKRKINGFIGNQIRIDGTVEEHSKEIKSEIKKNEIQIGVLAVQ